MPLDSSAMQTTATNSTTYLVNKRRRVFVTGASAAACCGASAPAASGRFEVRQALTKSRTLMTRTVSNVGPPCPPLLRDAARSFNRIMRRKQPSCHTPDKRDELTPPHSRTSFARATNTSDNETPSDAAVLRLMAM